MRILVAHSIYRIAGGENRYVEQQMELLTERHEVELLQRSNLDLDARLSTAARMTYSARVQREVEQVLDRFEPDLVHLHNAYPSFGPAVHLATERRKVPLVMTVHNTRMRCPNGLNFTEGKTCRRCQNGAYHNAVFHHCFDSRAQAGAYALGLWAHRFLLKLEGKVRLFITPSLYMRDHLLRWGIPPERIEVVRNFTELHDASEEPGSCGAYVGRVSSEKGIDVLLRALAAAGDPPFRIIGDGPRATELKELANELGLANTTFVGLLGSDRVVEELRRARFVVIPSVGDENAPMVALEALAAGRPLIVSSRGGLPELVAGGEGLVCEAGDVSDLAAQIERLMGDQELCREVGRKALSLARREFPPDVHLTRLEGAYDRALTAAT